jgi:hypothetical protein
LSPIRNTFGEVKETNFEHTGFNKHLSPKEIDKETFTDLKIKILKKIYQPIPMKRVRDVIRKELKPLTEAKQQMKI